MVILLLQSTEGRQPDGLSLGSGVGGTIIVGNARYPSGFKLRRNGLFAVAEGVTPITLRAPVGLYEIELQNDVEKRTELVKLLQGATWDAIRLGLPLDTHVPVQNALHRSQTVSEAVSRLSAELRDAKGCSGLVVALLPQTRGQDGAAKWGAGSLAILDADRRRRASLDWRFGSPNLAGVAEALPPGGWILSFPRGPARLEMPVWVSRGFQTLVFVPLAQEPDLGNVSIHMAPIASVWTGFDEASSLLEVALHRVRSGERPFGAAGTEVDFEQLAHVNPILTLTRALDLQTHGDHVRADRLIATLARLIPGHPDLEAMRERSASARLLTPGSDSGSFPPVSSTALDVVTAAGGLGRYPVTPRSLLDLVMAARVAYGPWATWLVRPGEPLAALERTPAVRSWANAPALGLAAPIALVELLPRWLASLGRRLWVEIRCRQLPREQLLERLVSGNDADPAQRLVRSHLSDLVHLGRLQRFTAALAGQGRKDLAIATGLSQSAALDALRVVRAQVLRLQRARFKA